MNLKFTALEIGSGDAFLLEDGDRKILFDAGGSQDLIVRLLKKKKIKKIDLAICSHNDIDHANGFIGLLKTDIIIEEIWLPGLWADILQFVIDNRNNSHTIWFELDEYLCNNEAKNYSPEKQRYIPDNLYKSESVSVESFDDHLAIISELVDSGFLSFGEEVWDYLNHFARFYDYSCEFAINLKRIMKIAALAYGNGCKIRWFEPVDRCVVSPIDYSFVALNSKQICKVKKLKNVACFMYALTLTKENQYSLVFEFFKNNAPVVRFSADSDVEYQSRDPYQNCIIVTAPHHGSDANEKVYTVLKGNDIIWVRSDRKSSKRPCPAFKSQDNVYCLACYDKNFQNEISFEYNHRCKQWHCQNGKSCECKSKNKK